MISLIKTLLEKDYYAISVMFYFLKQLMTSIILSFETDLITIMIPSFFRIYHQEHYNKILPV